MSGTPEGRESLFTVYGRNNKRGCGSKRWHLAAAKLSEEQAHATAWGLAQLPIAWRYTIVVRDGCKPSLRDREHYCQWTIEDTPSPFRRLG